MPWSWAMRARASMCETCGDTARDCLMSRRTRRCADTNEVRFDLRARVRRREEREPRGAVGTHTHTTYCKHIRGESRSSTFSPPVLIARFVISVWPSSHLSSPSLTWTARRMACVPCDHRASYRRRRSHPSSPAAAIAACRRSPVLSPLLELA